MTGREAHENEWLRSEVARYAHLTDAGRVRIMCDLFETRQAIQSTKSPEQIQREEEVRHILEEEPGRTRYRALIAKFA